MKWSLGLAAAAAFVLAAPANADNDNTTALDVGAEFQASEADLMDDGLVENTAEVDAEAGNGEVGIHGLAAAETTEGMVVVFDYRFQEPNKVSRNEKKIKVKQDDDLQIELGFCTDMTAFQEEDCTGVELGAVSGCSGKAKVSASGEDLPELSLKVSCKDFPDAVAEGLDPDQQAQLDDVLGGDSNVKVRLKAEAIPLL